MPALPKTTIPIRFGGLRTDVDPKTGPVGYCSLIENAQALRLTEGGVELVKRNGLTYHTKPVDVFTLAAITQGRKVAALGKELVVSDGKVLYSLDTQSGTWAAKGRCPSLGALRSQIEGIPSFGTVVYNEKTEYDAAYAAGYVVFVVSFTDASGPGIAYYVTDVDTGAVVARGTIGSARRGRVMAIGSTFFLFTYDTTNGLSSYKMAAGPNSFGSRTTVVAAASMGSHFFDATVDTANGRMVVAYRNSTPGLTLVNWTTSQTAATTGTYNTRDPDRCIGFLHQSWTVGGNVYLGINGSVAALRVLSFDTATLSNQSDDSGGAVGTVRNITGWREAAASVLIYEVTGASTDLNRVEACRFAGATITSVKRGVGLASRVFKVGTTYHFSVALESTSQRHQYLLEMQPGGSLGSAVFVEGLLMTEDAGGHNPDGAFLGGPAEVASDRFLLGAMAQIGAGTGVSGSRHYTVERFDLRFNEDLLGPPVAFNGAVHLPGACGMTYDGAFVLEEGFLAFPEAPAVTGAGGAIPAGTYRHLAVVSRIDRTGRVSRSVASPITTTVLGAPGSFSVVMSTLRMLTKDFFRTAPNEKLELYRSTKDSANFFLVATFDNDSTVDVLGAYVDSTTDANLVLNEPLYLATGQAPNAMPPVVLSYCKHRDRLHALSGDGAQYFTKDTSAIGEAAQFAALTDGFFLDYDAVDGEFSGLASDGTTLFVFKRNRIWPVQGDGPDLAGNNTYQFPLPLSGSTGLRTPRGFVATPEGIIIDTPDGKQLLAGGTITPLPGSEAYDALTVTGGVALEDRSMAVLTTAEGRSLVWDWQHKMWVTWTNHAAVAACLWFGVLTLLGSDGQSKFDNPAAHADNGSDAIAFAVEPVWILGRHTRWKKALLEGEFLASTTVSYTPSYDHDPSTAETPRTLAVTASTKPPLVLIGARGRCDALKFRIEESSTTAGIKLSELVLEIAPKQGLSKYGSGKYLR